MLTPEMEEILHALVPVAQKNLETYDELVPVGAIFGEQGPQLVVASLSDPEDEEAEVPPTTEIIRYLEDSLRELPKTMVVHAAGYVFDGVIQGAEYEDALIFRISIPSGQAAGFFLPYKKEADAYVYADPILMEDEDQIFSA